VTRAETREADRFARDVANHKLTVLRDEGLYRHLRFKAPDGSTYWFDLITWPGYLTITGDMGTYVFARTQDMFEFFRSHRSTGFPINPGYWAEKIRAADQNTAPRAHSEETVVESLVDRFVQAIGPRGQEEWGEDDPDRAEHLARVLGDLVLDHERDGSLAFKETTYAAIRLAAQDLHTPRPTYWTDTRALAYWDACRKADPRDNPAMISRRLYQPAEDTSPLETLDDAWELRTEDYTVQYLWCCHAILWGIRKYDARDDNDEPPDRIGGRDVVDAPVVL